MKEKLTQRVTVSRITTGQGQSELGAEILLNVWGRVDIPGLEEGDVLEIEITKIEKPANRPAGSHRRSW